MKSRMKTAVDIVMTVLLFCLMAYQVTGDKLHEWIGIGMTAALIIHHLLNIPWYKALFRGRYNAFRAVTTVINTLLLLSISLTAFSGMSMSNHAVPFLYGMTDMVFARTVHLALSYWSFILMGLHLGLHLPALTGKIRPEKSVRLLCTCLFTLLAGVGLWLFIQNGIPGYISFRAHFAFFDYDKPAISVFLENIAMEFFFAFLGANTVRLIRNGNNQKQKNDNTLIPVACVLAAVILGLLLNLFAQNRISQDASLTPEVKPAADERSADQTDHVEVNDGFVLIQKGSFLMGSPEEENWRIEDETQHEVSVFAFYIDPYETTQEEYMRIMGNNPSTFAGNKLPVENLNWLEAVSYANAKSADAGLMPAYTIEGNSVSWDRSANGYRLPTEAEWEYACRAGTLTPFNTQHSLSADDANFYGHYPYEIEENYFNDSVLEAKPGVYRAKTVDTGSFKPNAWGLYDMHGNVNEWCWDWYGSYDSVHSDNPAGSMTGTRHVYRGGGWNDFAKNMRSAYRAAGQSDLRSYNLGIRLVRNADSGVKETLSVSASVPDVSNKTKILIAYFSWSGNTRGIAKEIQRQTGADIFEISPQKPYSSDYNTVLMEAQEDQHRQARPELNAHVENMEEYGIILLGYPNWWASIPMPVASFLEEYELSGKVIIPFCSHGGGRFGQSLTAIAKLAPDCDIKEGLSVHYSGGSSMPEDVTKWLKSNGIAE